MPIVCLESNWNGNNPSGLSIWSVLEQVAGIQKDTALHLKCNTWEELTYNISHMTYGFKQGTLYIAMHGLPGKVLLGNGTRPTMEELADVMKKRFRGWHVHFGSCRTLDISDERLKRFKKTTGARLLSGYLMNIDWIESTAMDMLLLSQAYQSLTPGRLWNQMEKKYESLVNRTGLYIV